MSATHIYLVFISLAVACFYLITAINFPQWYVFATYEDMYGEWGQFFFFLAAFIFSLLNTLNPANGRYRRFFILLALASFYTCMEEISWGQRLFDLETPDFFANNSYQDEINLHNLLTGPVESWSKTLLTYLISIGLLVYGMIFPLTLTMHWKPAIWFENQGLVAPPLALSPAFLIAAICEMEFFSFNEAEVAELLVAMAMAFIAFNRWLNQHRFKHFKPVYGFIVLTLIMASLAYTTTRQLLSQPAQQAQIKSRLANGYKKFADRYERYDYDWAIIEVLKLYDELKPDNTVILRKIARYYQNLEQWDKADQYLNRAIAVGLKRYQDDPNNIPTLISLAKSYHRLERPEKVRLYAQQAYNIALQQVNEQSDNKTKQAYGYYWLAKACEQLNKQPEALKYYRKAHKTKPNNDRYERAYYKKRRLMEKYYEEDWAERVYTH